MLSLKALGEDLSLYLPSFWWLLEVLGVLGLGGASLQSLPSLSHGVLPACVSVYDQICLSL